MSNGLLLIGGGGHCKSIIDSLFSVNTYDKLGIVDYQSDIENIMGVKVVGCDDDLPKLFNQGYRYAFISKGSVGNAVIRQRLYERAKGIGYEMVSIIDASAIISQQAVIESGCYIGKGAIVNASALVKDGAIINTGAIVEHDCVIGRFAHLASGVVLGGGVEIGDRTHVGSNAVIKQILNVGEDVLIGIGSVVTKPIENGVTAYGNPCRTIKTNEE